jgi:hypothetical protein
MNSRAEIGRRLFGARADHDEGLMDRLPGSDMSSEVRQQIRAAEIKFEAAAKTRDEIRRDAARAELDDLWGEYRAGQGAAAQPEEPQTSFDAGVQRRFHKPAYQEAHERANESPAALMRRAFEASAERGQRRGSFP